MSRRALLPGSASSICTIGTGRTAPGPAAEQRGRGQIETEERWQHSTEHLMVAIEMGIGRHASMPLSVSDVFAAGVGPSSSHDTGPMQAGRMFADVLHDGGTRASVDRPMHDLFGSLGTTGAEHGPDVAVILGLEGDRPGPVDTSGIAERVARIERRGLCAPRGQRTRAGR